MIIAVLALVGIIFVIQCFILYLIARIAQYVIATHKAITILVEYFSQPIVIKTNSDLSNNGYYADFSSEDDGTVN